VREARGARATASAGRFSRTLPVLKLHSLRAASGGIPPLDLCDWVR
jgi:hypothetical protein